MKKLDPDKYLCPSCRHELNVKTIPDFCPECGTPILMYAVLLEKLEQITRELREIKEIIAYK